MEILDREREYIKNNYKNNYNKDIANYLGWTIKKVETIAITKMGLHKSKEFMSNMYRKMGNLSYQKNPERASIAGKKAMEKLKLEGKDKEWHRKGGLSTKLKHPNLAAELGKKRWMEHPEHFKKMAELTNANPESIKKRREGLIRFRENNKDLYKEVGRKNMLVLHKKKPEFFIENIKRTNQKLRNKNNFVFMDTHFDSNAEKEFCKNLVDKGYIEKPIEKANCHFNVANLEFDFFLHNIFIEYHPYNKHFCKGLSIKEYYNKRRKVLDNNNYSLYPLMIIQDLKEFDTRVIPYFEMNILQQNKLSEVLR